MVLYTNVDKPGVIGYVGTVLGKNKINIAAMQVGRKSNGGENQADRPADEQG